MNAFEQAARLPEVVVWDDLGSISARTREVLAARRTSTRRRGWLVRRMLLAADLVGLALAFVLTETFFTGRPAQDSLATSSEYLVFVATLPLWILVAKLHGLYDRDEERTDHSTLDDTKGVFHLVTIGAWVVFAISWWSSSVDPEFSRLVAFWALAIALLTVGRATARAYCRRQIAYLQNTLIVGEGDVGQLVARKLLNHPEYGLNLVGFVDADPRERRSDLSHLANLGTPDHVPELVDLLDVERVIIAFSHDSHEDTLDLIRSLKDLDVQIDIVPRLFEVVGGNVGVHSVEGVPLVGLPPLRLSRSSRLLKRAIDLTLASVGLLVLSPLLIALAIWIKLDSRGPILFRQVRMGSGETPFRIFKFRTMYVDAEERKAEVAHLNMHLADDPRMFKIPDDPRITRVGKLLRRFSFDELPQLLNVISGEMSLVGPRPIILDEDRWVEGWARKRLDLKPGVTGLWQVLGSSEIPFDEMTKLDYLYVTNWSLSADLRLIFQTIPALLRTRNAY